MRTGGSFVLNMNLEVGSCCCLIIYLFIYQGVGPSASAMYVLWLASLSSARMEAGLISWCLWILGLHAVRWP